MAANAVSRVRNLKQIVMSLPKALKIFERNDAGNFNIIPVSSSMGRKYKEHHLFYEFFMAIQSGLGASHQTR
jgi:hypothetical protein